MINFNQVDTDNKLKEIESLAYIIWHEHYTPIIGKEQVEYMLDKFQSVISMRNQLNQGYQYFLIYLDENAVGYLSFEKRKTALFLSKIYVLKKHRGKGVGRKAMEFIISMAKGLGCEKVTLTVNRFNKNSIRAYGSAGFEKKGELVQDIGNGFVMDDFLMEKAI